MFIQRDVDQQIGYFGNNDKNQTIELGDQVCLTLEKHPEVEVVAEVTSITNENYKVKVVEFEVDESIADLPLKLNQVLDISSEFVQYVYKEN